MSYILDALKKAEQGRNQGKAPALFAVQTVESPIVRKPIWPWIVAGVLVINCAAFFYWLQKGGAQQSRGVAFPLPQQSTSITAHSIPESEQTPSTTEPVMESAPKRLLPPVEAPDGAAPSGHLFAKKEERARVAKVTPVNPEMKQDATPFTPTPTKIAPAPVTQATPAATEAPQAQRPLQLSELPDGIQQEIPKLVVAMHMYSDKPSNRLVTINDKPLREGSELSPGMKVVEIMPDGTVFTYKGYRFKKPLH